MSQIATERKRIIQEAKKEAQRIIQEANAEIERTIREIREAEAAKDETRSIRQRLTDYKEELSAEAEAEALAQAKKTQREVERLLARRQRHAERKTKGKETPTLGLRTEAPAISTLATQAHAPLEVGSVVRIEGQKALGTILSISDREASVALGALKTTIPLKRLHGVSPAEAQRHLRKTTPAQAVRSSGIIDQIHQKRLGFRQEIDVRGFRASEAVDAVAYFVDEALQLGVNQVRILHGTGTGALRESIRTYLSGVAGVEHFHDEDVRFGGAGITVVEMA